MGWRERDWARLNDDERRALFGDAAPAASARTTSVLRQPVTSRTLLAALVGVVLAGFVGVKGLPLGGPVIPQQHVVHVRPPVVYGDQTTPPVGAPGAQVDPNASLGPPGSHVACTQKQVDQATGQWVCTSYRVVYPGQQIVAPPNP